MKIRIPQLLPSLLLAAGLAHAEVSYQFVPNFLTPPPGKETIGDGHGEIQVDSAGNIYVSVQGQPEGGLQVYSPEGKFLRQLPLPGSLHGFSIRKLKDGEFIIAAVLEEQKVLKATLDGKVVLEIPKTAFPKEIADAIRVTTKDGKTYSGHSPAASGNSLSLTQADGKIVTLNKADIAQKAAFTLADGKKIEGLSPEQTDSEISVEIGGKRQSFSKDAIAKKDGKPAITIGSAETRSGLKLTSADAASNGDLYVVDGYGTSWIFVFDSNGQFKKQFGGPEEAFKLKNCHKVHIDTRFSPERVFLCDRANKRIMHASLDGQPLGVIATGLRNPSSASFHGDLVCIAEIAGRVSVWDKDGKMVAALGTNDTPGQTSTPLVPPADWKDNTVTSPHGITFDAKGNILETEWNKFGRVLRWNRK
jgi:hypothetical protein